MFSSAGSVLLLAFGFGFVIFWHELGHFLAAKWADVKVEQFAVGFGQALFSWRKGLGFRWGSTQTDYQSKLRDEVERTAAGQPQLPEQASGPSEEQLAAAGDTLGISETEYRLNWIPLGGYVKMLGQDDLRPGEQVANPRSYTAKPVGKRMVIVSAGVIMNVILAAIGFMVLFTVGYQVSSPTVGQVVPGSPAQLAVRQSDGSPAPIRAGDTIEYINGKWQADFDKIRLNTPLLIADESVPIEVLRADGKTHDRLRVTPTRQTPDSDFPQLGIAPGLVLKGPDAKDELPPFDARLESPELDLFHAGDVVTAVAGRPVTPDQFAVLADALQQGGGKPVTVTVSGADGRTRPVVVPAHFAERFGTGAVDFGGLEMLPEIGGLQKDSSAVGKLQPGDVVVDIADLDASGGHRPYPTREEMTKFTRDAGETGAKLHVTVLRDGVRQGYDLVPSVKVDKDHKGLGVQLDDADAVPVVAHPPADSPADRAHVPGGATLVSIDGHPVKDWFDVYTAMCGVQPNQPVVVAALVDGQAKRYTLAEGLPPAALAAIRENRLESRAALVFQPARMERRAKNPFQAAEWGVGETRDAIVQVYLTVKAMFRGSVSPKELSGPVGILAVGYKFAEDSYTRLLWFLSIISANLAVMNFLPIPVVDGGLFTFLIIEKLKGSPISQRTQSIAQVVGLVLLLSVFVFATWQDVSRIPQLFH